MLTQHYRLSPTVALRNTTPFRNQHSTCQCLYICMCTSGRYGGCRRVPQSIPTCGTSRAVVSCSTRHLTTLHNTEHTNLQDVPCSSIDCSTRHLTTLHNTEHTTLRDVPCNSSLFYQIPYYSSLGAAVLFK